MINTGRPISVFSFFATSDLTFDGFTFKEGQNQIIREQPLEDRTVSPNLFVYHGSDFYKVSYMTVHDKCVKHLMEFLKGRHIDGGDYIKTEL